MSASTGPSVTSAWQSRREDLAGKTDVWLSPDAEAEITNGALGGVLAAAPFVAALAVAAALRSHGAATAFYAVAATVDPGPLRTAMDAQASGHAAGFVQEAFTVGLGAVVAAAAVLGVAFAWAVRRRRGATWRFVVVGSGYGAFLAAVTAMVLVGTAGGPSQGGIDSLVGIVGWPALLLAHLLYGAALGAYAARRRLSPKRW